MLALRKWFARFARKRSYALNDLDLKLARYLPRRGFFVEAGANDGIRQSNTLYFEQRGWRGLLVEPIPELAGRCRQNRPRCIVENLALVGPGGPERVNMRYADLMSVVRGGMKSAAEEEQHIRKGCEIQDVTSYEVEVPGQTLSRVLDRHEIDQVDLLSLDVEGFERSVLEGLDLGRHRPTWMVVESRYREDIVGYLAPHYDLVDQLSHHDLLFRVRPTP